jgi:hypothetical protein
MLFTVSGNGPHASLEKDLDAIGTKRDHYVVNIHVEDHQDFIAAMYLEAEDLGAIDELTAFLTTATVDGILGRLLYRGAAWSLMRAEGKLPPNAPPLGGGN